MKLKTKKYVTAIQIVGENDPTLVKYASFKLKHKN